MFKRYLQGKQRNIVVVTCILHNFIRIHDGEDEGFKWDELGSNADEGGEYSSSQESMENIHHEEMKVFFFSILLLLSFLYLATKYCYYCYNL
jgi:hypothetical protein